MLLALLPLSCVSALQWFRMRSSVRYAWTRLWTACFWSVATWSHVYNVASRWTNALSVVSMWFVWCAPSAFETHCVHTCNSSWCWHIVFCYCIVIADYSFICNDFDVSVFKLLSQQLSQWFQYIDWLTSLIVPTLRLFTSWYVRTMRRLKSKVLYKCSRSSAVVLFMLRIYCGWLVNCNQTFVLVYIIYSIFIHIRMFIYIYIVSIIILLHVYAMECLGLGLVLICCTTCVNSLTLWKYYSWTPK